MTMSSSMRTPMPSWLLLVAVTVVVTGYAVGGLVIVRRLVHANRVRASRAMILIHASDRQGAPLRFARRDPVRFPTSSYQ
jgi:hypothetical protein